MKGFQNNFFYDLFLFFLRFPFMIFLWVQIVVMIFYGFGYDWEITYDFLCFGYDFFMALDMFF